MKAPRVYRCTECGQRRCAEPNETCEHCMDRSADFDPENIYNIPSMRQSVEEDRRTR